MFVTYFCDFAHHFPDISTVKQTECVMDEARWTYILPDCNSEFINSFNTAYYGSFIDYKGGLPDYNILMNPAPTNFANIETVMCWLVKY